MSLFRCPVCAAPLTRGKSAYTCPAGHSYDLSRDGYVHLLPANRMHSKTPGDDKGMASARSRFLATGAYSHLCDALSELALFYTDGDSVLLDSGCGEGYYTSGVLEALRGVGRRPRAAGIDISKFCLRYAARREKDCEFAVASAYHLPVEDSSVDLLLNCFSPLALEEVRRVLRPGGVFLYVVPAPDHLWELKEILYEKPYRNAEEAVAYDGFEYVTIVSCERTVHVEGQALSDLFQMTPYFWKTPKEGAERLAGYSELDVQADFRIHVFRKK